MIKSASNILSKNIPDDIYKEGISYGNIDPEWIFNAMREYAAQFIDLAIENPIQFGNLNNFPEYLSKSEVLKIKQLIK